MSGGTSRPSRPSPVQLEGGGGVGGRARLHSGAAAAFVKVRETMPTPIVTQSSWQWHARIRLYDRVFRPVLADGAERGRTPRPYDTGRAQHVAGIPLTLNAHHELECRPRAPGHRWYQGWHIQARGVSPSRTDSATSKSTSSRQVGPA